MSSVFTPKRMRISTDRYHKMIAAGVFTEYDRVELIEGEMLDMAPIGSSHTALVSRLNELFVLAAARWATVVVGGPVVLGAFSEPQPDLMLLKRRKDFYAGKHAEAADVLLLLEVSDSSLRFDQGVKMNLYARYGVAEYWVVDLQGRRVVIYRDPGPEGYLRKDEFTAPGVVAPQAFPDLKISVGELFGQADSNS